MAGLTPSKRFIGALALAALASQGLPALDLSAQVRGSTRGGRTMSTSRVVSPAVVASWMSRENFADGSGMTLLVLWRGTPGWFSRSAGGSGGRRSSGGGSGSGGSYGFQSVSEGGLTFMMEFDYDRRIVKMLSQEISLTETNVVLVDFVDGGDGPAIVGFRWIEPAPPSTGDPIAGVVKRAPELFEYLQCDLSVADLPDPVMRAVMPIFCEQLRP
jgi:hypothetical protein